MVWPLVLLAASAAGQIGSQLLNKPRRQKLGIENLMRLRREGTLGDINAATSNFGTQLAPILASRGLNRTGVGPQMVSQYNQGLTQRGLQDLDRYRRSLLERQNEYDQQYENEKAQRLPRLLSTLSELASQGAGVAESESQNAALMRLLQRQRDDEDYLYEQKVRKALGLDKSGTWGYYPWPSGKGY